MGGDRLTLTAHRHPAAPPPIKSDRRDEAFCNWVAEVQTQPTGKTDLDPTPPAPDPIRPNDKLAGRVLPPGLLRDFPSLRALEGVLRVENYDDPDIRAHVAALAGFPPKLLKRLRQAGLTDLHVAARSVPYLDSNEELQGVRPRGWPDGLTWSSVAGNYNPTARSVSIGKAEAREGAASLAQHETAHAIGALLGFDMDPRVMAHYDRLFDATVPHLCDPSVQLPKLSPYLRQVTGDGDRLPGRQEFFAESIAVYLTEGRAAALEAFDEPWVKFLESEVLGIEQPGRKP
jgi:hypothetical protein